MANLKPVTTPEGPKTVNLDLLAIAEPYNDKETVIIWATGHKTLIKMPFQAFEAQLGLTQAGRGRQ